MTPDQMASVHADALRLGDLSAVSAVFYRNLFAAAPEVRSLFPDDLVAQQAKFAAQLGDLLRSIDDFAVFVGPARALGGRHHAYAVRAAHFPIVREALLAALAEALGPSFDEACVAAWRSAYDLLAEVMLSAPRRPAGEYPEGSPANNG